MFSWWSKKTHHLHFAQNRWRAGSRRSISRMSTLGGDGYPMWLEVWITSLGIYVMCGHLLTYVMCSFHTDLVLEMIALSLGPFLLYVFDLGRHMLEYFCLCIFIHLLCHHIYLYPEVVLITLLGETLVHIYIFWNSDMVHFCYSTLIIWVVSF